MKKKKIDKKSPEQMPAEHAGMGYAIGDRVVCTVDIKTDPIVKAATRGTVQDTAPTLDSSYVLFDLVETPKWVTNGHLRPA